jgi:hypothetical protein
LAQEQSLATLSLQVDQRPCINFDNASYRLIYRPDPTASLEPELQTLEVIHAEYARLQEQNRIDLIESQQPDSIVAVNPHSIR